MILISARSTSKRFPLKHLAPLNGSTIFDIMIDRLRGVLPFAFLIPTGDPYKAELDKRGVEVFEGPEDDVLKRYALAMAHYNLYWCIRVTGDCPLVSLQDIAWLARVCALSQIDYGNNFSTVQADGLEVEYLSWRLVKWMDQAPLSAHDREHVTPFIRKHVGEPYMRCYAAPIQYGWHGAGKLSVDTPEDLERVERVMKEMEASP